MPTHKISTIVQSSVKGPSALKSSTCFHGPKKQKPREATRAPHIVVPETVTYILKQCDGNLEKASKLMDEKLSATNRMIHELTESKSHLTDEQFYARLTELKEQHSNTVAMCEDLYSLTQRDEFPAGHQQAKSVTFKDEQNSARTGDVIRASLAELESRVSLDSEWRDAKPPLPRGQTRSRQPERQERRRPLSASLDGFHWPPKSSEDEEEEEEAGQPEDDETALRRRYQELLRSQMKPTWADVRPRTSSLDRSWGGRERREESRERREDRRSAQSHEESWRHRVTVPQPFSMTLREESQSLKKSRSMILFEENERQRREQEEAECRVRFRANPVPAHVFVPLFDELQENSENRRREVRQHSRELLKSQERPFNFAKREEEKKRRQKTRLSEADRQKQLVASSAGDRQDSVIRARPVPASVRRVCSRRQEEDEIFRQIKVRMRAEQTLRQSAAPGEMMERQRLMEEKRAERLAKFEMPAKRRPQSADGRRRVGRDAPDFDRLHRAFQLELLERQSEAKVTRPSPFRLRTEKRGHRIQQKAEEQLLKQRDPKSVKTLRDRSQRYPSDQRSARAIDRHEDSPPARLTHSAQLRERRRTAERQAAEKRRREAEAAEFQRSLRRRQLAQELRASGTGDADAAGPSIRERTRTRQDAQRELEEDYRQKLRELNEKMKERDLLVVQQAKLIAQQKARARYRQTLLDAGVDPKKVDDMAKNFHEDDVAAYADDLESSAPVNGSEFDEDNQDELDETRFGMPSPVQE